MNKLFILLVFLSGCAGWQVKSKVILTDIFKATKSISSVVEPAYDVKCTGVANECKKNNDKICDKLKKCEDELKVINKGIIGTHTLVSMGYTSIALGDEKQTGVILSKTLLLLKDVYEKAKKYGVF